VAARSKETASFPLSSPDQSSELFERFPYGLVLVDSRRAVLRLNRYARELLGPGRSGDPELPRTCCELICRRVSVAPGDGCLTRRALASAAPLPEVRIDIEKRRSQAAAWVTASALDPDGSRLLFHLRPGAPGDRRRRTVPHGTDGRLSAEPTLRIFTLGALRVEGGDGSIAGDWLQKQPGELLRYLVCERGKVVPDDQIAQAFGANGDSRNASNRVRQSVHVLRERLEPRRPKRSPSHFVISRPGGYTLDTKRVWIDADGFEDQVRAGLTAFAQGQRGAALDHLEEGIRLYQDDFFADDPYLEWALEERDQLREVAGRALRAMLQIHADAGDLDAAKEQGRRLAAMEPFDSDVQRRFLEICLRQGRRSEAARRYQLLRNRMRKQFGEEPDFRLSDLVG
jgi:DNA-binding SARP family transcriptional activator